MIIKKIVFLELDVKWCTKYLVYFWPKNGPLFVANKFCPIFTYLNCPILTVPKVQDELFFELWGF